MHWCRFRRVSKINLKEDRFPVWSNFNLGKRTVRVLYAGTVRVPYNWVGYELVEITFNSILVGEDGVEMGVDSVAEMDGDFM